MNDERSYEFFSQQGEDVFVYRNFLNRPLRDGVFVEVGAYDGVQGSNTKFFEDVLGYTGVLVEPVKAHIQTILHHRPHSKLYSCAIHPTAAEIEFAGNSAVAGIVSCMSDKHRDTWGSCVSTVEHVPCGRLDDILEHAAVDHIDFLSIDVEGGELLVLETMNWNIETFVICIELDGENPTKDANCREILKDHGFTFQTFVGNNDIWVNLNYSRRHTRYSTELAPYSAVCKYLNAETQQKLPELLESFVSPL